MWALDVWLMRWTRARSGEGPGFTNFFPISQEDFCGSSFCVFGLLGFCESERRSYLRSRLLKSLNWEVSPRACKLDSSGFWPSLVRKRVPGTWSCPYYWALLIEKTGLGLAHDNSYWPNPKGYRINSTSFYGVAGRSLKGCASAQLNLLFGYRDGFREVLGSWMNMRCPWLRHQLLRCWGSPWKQPEHLGALKWGFST